MVVSGKVEVTSFILPSDCRFLEGGLDIKFTTSSKCCFFLWHCTWWSWWIFSYFNRIHGQWISKAVSAEKGQVIGIIYRQLTCSYVVTFLQNYATFKVLSLCHWIRTIDRRKRLIIAMDTAFGMEYLHGKNIVHFDLKCENLLVNMRDPQRPVCKV